MSVNPMSTPTTRSTYAFVSRANTQNSDSTSTAAAQRGRGDRTSVIHVASNSARSANVTDSLRSKVSQRTISVVRLKARTTAKTTGRNHEVWMHRATTAAKTIHATVENASCAT